MIGLDTDGPTDIKQVGNYGESFSATCRTSVRARRQPLWNKRHVYLRRFANQKPAACLIEFDCPGSAVGGAGDHREWFGCAR